MNLYRSLGRWYVQFDWADPVNGYRLAIGRHAEPITDQYAADDTYPAHIECPEAHMGNVISPVCAQSFQPYDEVGGESGWSQAIKEAHEDSPQAMNWVRPEDGS